MRGTVVVCDDELDCLESTALLVESLGYRAVRVQDAAEVLDVVDREQPGVLLQDLRMPGLNLAGLVAALRSSPRTADVHIVLWSGAPELPQVAVRHRTWGHLAKPFRLEELRHLLDLAFRETHAQDKDAHADVHEEVRGAFHDYWDLLAAVNNYVHVLDAQAQGLDERARSSVKGLSDLVLKLEARTERLRSHLLAVSNRMQHLGA